MAASADPAYNAAFYAARAYKQLAEDGNAKRKGWRKVDAVAQVAGMLELYLADDPDFKRPEKLDPFTLLVGQAVALGATMFHGNTEWAAPIEETTP